jgi:hypothetical protein
MGNDEVQVRSLTTFKSPWGLIRTGQFSTFPSSYAREQILLGHVEAAPKPLRPERVQSFKQAPRIAPDLRDVPITKKEPSPEENPGPLSTPSNLDTGEAPDSGETKPASLSRADRRSNRRTSSTREAKPV